MITLEKAKLALGETGMKMSDSQILQTVSLFQSLAESWLDDFERTTFQGKTVKMLLTENERAKLL